MRNVVIAPRGINIRFNLNILNLTQESNAFYESRLLLKDYRLQGKNGRVRSFVMTRKTMLRDREVQYTVKKSARARHLRVAIYCDASVVVTVPVNFGEYKIERFLKEKANWVLKKLDYFLRLSKITRIGGGRREYKKYREQAREFARMKVEKINQIYNFSFGKIFIKNHKTRWGSCSKKQNLNFNFKIIFLTERLAEYIVTHELCHLQEFNHSRKFWDLLARAIPDYRQCRKELKKVF